MSVGIVTAVTAMASVAASVLVFGRRVMAISRKVIASTFGCDRTGYESGSAQLSAPYPAWNKKSCGSNRTLPD